MADEASAPQEPSFLDKFSGWYDTNKQNLQDIGEIATGIYSIFQGGLGQKSETPLVGYQGAIPHYVLNRNRLPIDDTGRRPGEAGRRYFSDTVYSQVPDTTTVAGDSSTQNFAAGGIASTFVPQQGLQPAKPPTPQQPQMMRPPQGIPNFLSGVSDGMADRVPASIDGQQPAALSDGEFVVPADVVSHLGNGNSNAGAQQLYQMLERIRKERTGNPKQGKQINPQQMLPR